MERIDLRQRLGGLDRPRGDAARTLILGPVAVLVSGLDRELAASLDARWGAFCRRGESGTPRLSVRLLDAGGDDWLQVERRPEPYRIDSFGVGAGRIVASYHFALGAGERPGHWRVGVTAQDVEPLDRVIENALRFLLARASVEDGGFALHAAGVLRDDRAYVLAGPSGSGKTTAVGQCVPGESLGDDFAMILPRQGAWVAPAVPFDNTERVSGRPGGGCFEVAGVWRLFQDPATRVERPPDGVAVASLLACAAFAWAMPDLAERLLLQAERFVETGRFRHLRFALGEGLWSHLI